MSFVLVLRNQIFNIITNCMFIFDNIIDKVYDELDGLKLYSVKHDLLNPFEKIYYNIFFPCLYITINYNKYTLSFTTNKQNFKRNKLCFFETCIINKRKIIKAISHKPLNKISNDFHCIPFIAINILNIDISKKIKQFMTDINLTADHICVLFKIDLGNTVTCYSNTLDTYVFKDIDSIK